MEHFYNKTCSETWFDFQHIYKTMVEKFGDDSHFVEVGTWKGMSACYMAVEIINSNKKIKFDCVDTWEFIPTSIEITEEQCVGLYDTFLQNIEPVKHVINIIRSLSWDAAKLYNDKSLDFVFIDAAHDYESVSKDLKEWFPKIKQNGIIAGHDYHYNVGVFPAVNEFFSKLQLPVKQIGCCWLVEV
jgi:predicted O-methyltransferase YrrM